MYKSALSILLVASLLMWTGCYDTVQLTREESTHANKHDEVTVLVDSAGTIWKYRFSKGMYRVEHDTLVGTGTKITDSGVETLSNVVIPISKIAIFEVKELNQFETLLLAGGVVGATILMVVMVGQSGGTPGSSTSPPTAPH